MYRPLVGHCLRMQGQRGLPVIPANPYPHTRSIGDLPIFVSGRPQYDLFTFALGGRKRRRGIRTLEINFQSVCGPQAEGPIGRWVTSKSPLLFWKVPFGGDASSLRVIAFDLSTPLPLLTIFPERMLPKQPKTSEMGFFSLNVMNMVLMCLIQV